MPRKFMVRDLLVDCIVAGTFYDIYSDYGKFCFVLSDPLFQWKQNIFKQGYESVYSVLIAAVIKSDLIKHSK